MYATAKNYEIIHTDTRYCTLYIWDVVLLPSESRALNNQRSRCDIVWLHATTHLYRGFLS